MSADDPEEEHPEGFEFSGSERFEIRQRLGSGGMGIVYEAYDRQRKALCALKMLRDLSPQSIYRFKQEFRSIQELQHSNVVTMGELLQVRDRWFFTMELVDGVDFLSYVRPHAIEPASADEARVFREAISSAQPKPSPPPRPRLDEARLRAALGQLAGALACLHAAGKVHRDVKPSNVRVTGEGRVVLLDFGLVRDTDRGQSTDANLVGTAAYMAPEQASGSEVGPAADWYALGVMLYEALTYELPHDGSTPFEILVKKQGYPPPPPRARAPGVPADLDRLCEDLLAIEPAARPSAERVIERLGTGPPRADGERTNRTSARRTQIPSCLGREHELELLSAAFDDVAANGARGVRIDGASGIGKSTLIRHATEAIVARRPDALILAGRCFERESMSYRALDGVVDALSQALRRMTDTEVTALLPLHAALLPAVFPTLGRVEMIANAPRVRGLTHSPQDLRTHVFQAMRELFQRLALRRPVVVVIDDIQWADSDSRVLLSEIARAPAPPILFLVASRCDENEPHPPEPQLLSAFNDVPLASCRLGRLRPEAAIELARRLGVGDAEALAREADGHPLFVAELARHVLAGGLSGAVRLDEAIVARARSVPEAAQVLLELICLAGAPLPQEVVRMAARVSAPVFDRQVAWLRSVYLVRTGGSRVVDVIEPYHDRVREAVAASVGDGDRPERHGRLALAMESTASGVECSAQLVDHWEAAGDADRAAVHARDGARHASATLAFDLAATLYERALHLGHPEPEERRGLLIERASALVNSGRSAEAAEAFVQASKGAGPALRLELDRQAAEEYLISGRLEEGLDAVARLLAEVGTRLPATPRRALVSLLWHRARFRLRGIRWKERHEEQIPREELMRIDIYRAVAHGLSMVDNIRGMDFQARGLLAALRSGELIRAGVALYTEVVFRAAQGGRGFRSAQRLLARCSPLADRHPLLRAWNEAAHAFSLYFGGRFADTPGRLAAVESLFMEHMIGKTWERNSLRLFHLLAYRQAGQFVNLRLVFDEMIRDAERRGDRYVDGTSRRAASRIWLVAGDPQRALQELARATWLPPEGRFHLQHWYELEARCEIALYQGRPAEGLVSFDRDLPALRHSLLLRVGTVRVFARDLRARLLLATAVDARAAKPLRVAARRLARQLAREKLPYASVLQYIVLAALAAQGADAAAAAINLRRALALTAESGQLMHAAACRVRLADLVGGHEGAALRSEAEAWMHSEGIVDPVRMVEVIAPGFPGVQGAEVMPLSSRREGPSGGGLPRGPPMR